MRPTELDQAKEFAISMRGQYILSQALCLAIEKMNEVKPEHMKEISNISDMEYLRDELFPIYKAVQNAELGTSQ
tara:strand:+ start:1338 stop:1559 length:222 start_codon:yes stop_codon:yes gene_type:complete